MISIYTVIFYKFIVKIRREMTLKARIIADSNIYTQARLGRICVAAVDLARSCKNKKSKKNVKTNIPGPFVYVRMAAL